MHKFPIFFLIFLFIAACQPHSHEANPPVREWVALNLDPNGGTWKASNGTASNFADGILQISASNQPSQLTSSTSYANFILELEYALENQTAQIGFRMPEGKGGYQVSLNNSPDTQNPTGSIVNIGRATWMEKTLENEWNKIQLKAEGDHLVVHLNGEKVAETHNKESASGNIVLNVPASDADGVAKFRNARIQALPYALESKPLPEEILREKLSQADLQPLATAENVGDWDKKGPGTFELKDGVLDSYSGETPSYFCSPKSYRNMYMKLEFKIAKEDNSGIFIRHHPDSNVVTTKSAIECNIYDSNGPSHAYSTGSIATHARAFYDLIDHSEWNEMEIFAVEEHVIMFVNGKKSSDAHLPEQFNQTGKICLQAGTRIFTDNGPSRIQFRNMVVAEL